MLKEQCDSVIFFILEWNKTLEMTKNMSFYDERSKYYAGAEMAASNAAFFISQDY